MNCISKAYFQITHNLGSTFNHLCGDFYYMKQRHHMSNPLADMHMLEIVKMLPLLPLAIDIEVFVVVGNGKFCYLLASVDFSRSNKTCK